MPASVRKEQARKLAGIGKGRVVKMEERDIALGMESMEPETDWKKERKFCSSIGMNFFLFFVVVSVIQIVISKLVAYLAPELVVSHYWVVMFLTMSPIYLIGYPFLRWISKKQQTVELEQHSMSGGDFMILLMMCFGVMIVGNIIGLLVNGAIGAIKGSPVMDSLENLLGNSSLAMNILIAGIAGPIFEELMFRKILVDRLARYGEAVAIVVSGLMFGLFHGNFGQFFYATFLGFLFAFVYLKTGKIKYSIFLHIIINMTSTLMLPVFQALDTSKLEELERLAMSGALMQNTDMLQYVGEMILPLLILIVYTFAMYGMAIAGIVLLFVNRKKFACRKGEITLPKGKKASILWGNVGMICYTLGCLVMFISVIRA